MSLLCGIMLLQQDKIAYKNRTSLLAYKFCTPKLTSTISYFRDQRYPHFILLLSQKAWREPDVVGGNLVASQLLCQVFSVIKAEGLIGALPVQFLPSVRIDMIHHQVYILLGQFIKAFSLWQYPADKFMSYLYLCFLIRSTWITVVDTCPLESFSIWSVLYAFGVGKFTPVISLILNS